MLGLGRASQYAGWWSGGEVIGSASISTASTMDYLNYQEPDFGIVISDLGVTGTASVLNNRTLNNGNVNFTDVNTYTGYDNMNATVFTHFRVPSTMTNAGSQQIMNWQLNSGTSSKTWYLHVYADSGNLGISSSRLNATTPLPITDIANQWLTFVCSESNSSSSFTNWNGSGSGNCYVRNAVYDTTTGELLYKQDQITTNTPIDLSGLGNVPTNEFNDPGFPCYQSLNNYGTGNSVTAGTNWISLGTMFDPVSVTDKSWLTPRPNAQIGNAVCLLNCQYTNFEQSGNIYYLTTSSMDKYTQTNNRVLEFVVNFDGNFSNQIWGNIYSNANPIESSSY
jgi:hypothetical protein